MISPRRFCCFAIFCSVVLAACLPIVVHSQKSNELSDDNFHLLSPLLKAQSSTRTPAEYAAFLRHFHFLFQTAPAPAKPAKKRAGKAVTPPTPVGKFTPPAPINPRTQKPNLLPGFSPNGTPPGTSVLPPPILPPAPLRRIALTPDTSAAPGSHKPCRLEIDVRNVQGAWGEVWRGVTLDSAAILSAQTGTNVSPRAFPAYGANYVRFDPFMIAGSVTLAPDGTPTVQWDAADALLQALHKKGANVILSLALPLPMTDTAWQSLVKATAVRYGRNPEYGVIRWEFAGQAGAGPQRLSAFAAAVHSAVPKASIGILLTSGAIAAGALQTATVCTAQHLTLTSFGWRSPAASAAAYELLQNVRRAFASQPSLRRCVLLPEADTSALSPGAVVGLAVRLTASNTPGGSNPLAGLLTGKPAGTSSVSARSASIAPSSSSSSSNSSSPSPSPSTSAPSTSPSSAAASPLPPSTSQQVNNVLAAASLTPDLAGLRLLNRAAGNRLRAAGEADDVRCLAVLGTGAKQDSSQQKNTQSNVALKNGGQGALSLLIWRDSAADGPPMLPVLIYLSGMTKNEVAKNNGAKIGTTKKSPGGLRLTRFDLRKDETVSTSEIDRPAATLDIPGGIGSGEIELTVSLARGGVTLLRLEDHNPPPLEIELIPSAGSAHTYVGGTTFDITAVIHNPTKQTLPIDLALTSSLRGIVSPAMSLLAPGNIAPNGSRALSLQLNAPALAADRDAFVTVQAGGETCSVYALRLRSPLKTELLTPRIDLTAPGKPGTARLRLTNYGKIPLTMTAITAAGTKNESVERIVVPVQTPQQKEMLKEITLRTAEADAGVYPVTLRLEGTGDFKGIVQQFPLQIGVPLLCHRAHFKESAKPEFAGELAAWTDAIPLGMGRAEQVHGKTWGGVGDLSAAAYSKWDERYFYLACDVTDDLFDPAPTAATMRDSDSVQFAISALSTTAKQNAGTARIQGGGNGMSTLQAQQFGIAQLADGRTALVRFVGSTGVVQTVPGAVVAIHRSGTRTLYEVALPWQQLAPFSRKEGAAFGISVLVNDRDGKANGSIEWGSGISGSVDSTHFPPLRLIR